MNAIPDDFDKLPRLVAVQHSRAAGSLERHEKLDDLAFTALRGIDLHEFADIEFPPREPILCPVLCKQDLGMLFAERGIGKTHVALAMAFAVASGGTFAGWKAPKPSKVAYLDGELQGSVLQQRLLIHLPTPEPAPGLLTLFNPDTLPRETPLPDLSTPDGQEAVEPVIDGADLIIVDNLSCWARVGRENEAESWLPLADWALRLRRRGAAVLFIHHAGRNGQARGTSKREDLLDVVLQLKRPANYDARDGAHFVLNFTKARHLQGDEAQSLEMKLSVHDDRAEWDIKTAEESTFVRVVEMTIDGLKPGEIADELGVNKSTVSRHMNHAKAMGLLRGVS